MYHQRSKNIATGHGQSPQRSGRHDLTNCHTSVDVACTYVVAFCSILNWQGCSVVWTKTRHSPRPDESFGLPRLIASQPGTVRYMLFQISICGRASMESWILVACGWDDVAPRGSASVTRRDSLGLMDRGSMQRRALHYGSCGMLLRDGSLLTAGIAPTARLHWKFAP